jgi:hypothetical protein
MGTPVSRIGFGLEPTSGGTGVTNQVRSIEGGKPSSLQSRKPFVRNSRLNFFAQFNFLYIREFKFFTRSIDSFIVRTALFAILSALVALMLFDIGTDAIGALTNMMDASVLETTLNDYYGAISIMILLGLFGN